VDRLAELRESQALTLRDLAERSGVDANTINQVELGHRKPRPSTLRKLAKALDVEVADFFREPAVPLAEAPREAGLTSLPTEWLERHSAKRLLMSDEEIIRNFERLASGSDRQVVPDRFEQEARETLREETQVLEDLQLEWARGGPLIPKTREPLNQAEDRVQQVMKRESARNKEYQRLGRETRSLYRRYLKTLDDFQVTLFLKGRVDDFVMVVSRPQIAEARKAALRTLQEEAFENRQGA
jgi:transcriptional regulator with XRE-family HTH domain